MPLHKRAKRKTRRSSHNAFRLGLPQKVIVFVLAFAAVGGIAMLFSTKAAIQYVAYPPHRAECVENSPSKTVVRPGESFTARVRIRNTGTSTFHPDFGVYLEELRDGSRTWNASGILLSKPAKPGEIATFNLSMKAPTKPGTYNFNWGIAVVMKGYMRTPCTGKSVTVMNPPSVTLRANNTNGNITLTRGASLRLSWSVSNSPSSCVASGSWSGKKSASGSENRSGDARTASTRTYRLTCSNGAGTSSATRTVTVKNPPAPKPTPSPRPSPPAAPSTASRPPSSSTPAPQPSRPRSDSNASPADSPAPTASLKPKRPTTLSALAVGDATVRLTWSRAEDDESTQGYEIQRSTDKKSWETIQEYATDEVYVDSAVQFETTYFYRVRSLGLDDQKSSYAMVEVTTNPFQSNTSDGDLTLESDDRKVTVIIPEGAIAEEAFCSLRNDHSKPSPEIKNHEVVLGPYEVLCKTESGAIISAFDADLQVSTQADPGSYTAVKLFSYRDNWREAADITTANNESHPVDTPYFAILGEKQSSPLFLKILLGTGIVIGIVAGGILLLSLIARYRQQQAIKSKIADYRSKERGF